MEQTNPLFFSQTATLTRTQGESLARMVSLIMPDAAVFTVDAKQGISYWSPGAEKLLGYSADSLQGAHCLTANRCEACMRGCGLQAADKVVAAPLRLYKADGTQQAVLKYAMAFTDAAGAFDGGLEILIPQAMPATDVAAASDLGERYGLIGHSPEMHQLLAMIRRVAASEMPVLIRGDSGTGKELVARAIHGESPRRDGPFIAINCASLNAGLLESELFGHVKGAFTGAIRDHAGLFRRAEAGTLFLDEVAELPMALQAKLLRVLETGEYLPVGGSQALQANVRLVAATHKALREEVKAGRFRQDLLFRLRVIPLFVPDLRSRSQDIPLIVRHLLKQQFSEGQLPTVSAEAMHYLQAYDWPGNVRELRNAIHYALVMSDGKHISLRDLPPEIQAATVATQPQPPRDQPASVKPRQALDVHTIEAEIAACNGNLSAAAKRLGIGRTTLWRYRKKPPSETST